MPSKRGEHLAVGATIPLSFLPGLGDSAAVVSGMNAS